MAVGQDGADVAGAGEPRRRLSESNDMSHIAPTIAVVLLSAVLAAGCTTFNLLGYDRLTDVQSICDVPFEEGMVVQVVADFDGDRYHGDGLFDSACKGVYWIADWTDDFKRRHAKRL